jgi:hypothetical protein
MEENSGGEGTGFVYAMECGPPNLRTDRHSPSRPSPDLWPRGDARMTGFVYAMECGDVGGRKT